MNLPDKTFFLNYFLKSISTLQTMHAFLRSGTSKMPVKLFLFKILNPESKTKL